MAAAARLTESMQQQTAAQAALPDDVDYEQVDQFAVDLMLEART